VLGGLSQLGGIGGAGANSLNGQPAAIGWDLTSDVGMHWGPGAGPVTAAYFPLRLPLQPF
jgi:hypothetical protein